MKLQKLKSSLKRKKKVLQARINASTSSQDHRLNLENVMVSTKRKNPFLTYDTDDNKRTCRDKTNCFPISDDTESNDNTLFKLFHLSRSDPSINKSEPPIPSGSTTNCLGPSESEPIDQLVKVIGEKWIPVDWTLKAKIRFLSEKPFGWSQKLKISEEASGVTSFSRCLDLDTDLDTATALDTSPNARFHQCCLVWQQPSLPWLPLFPRSNRSRTMGAATNSIGSGPASNALHLAFCDGLRSLHQLIRTRQCAYFYACADAFSVLFRAAGVAGFPDTHALITPTTRGLRQMLKVADVEFTMPLKKVVTEGEVSKDGHGDVQDDVDDNWMESMGINKDDIKQINFTQARITQKSESTIDHSDQSLVFVEGLEVQALYNFLINSCKSTISPTGPLAGVPPTLLAPVAFTGATLTPLQVRESKVHVDQDSYYSVDITGPILPNTIHTLLSIAPKTHTFTATFSNIDSTTPFSHMTMAAKQRSEGSENETVGAADVFQETNLSDCGLPGSIVKRFCSVNERHVAIIDCLKYTVENKSYAWS